MFDLRKTLGFPYINIKFLGIIFILILLALISDVVLLISTALILIIGTGFFATLLNTGKLNRFDKKTWSSIFKFSGVFILISIVFLIIEGIIVFIGFIPYYLVSLSTNINSALIVVVSIVMVLFMIIAGIVELIKLVGLIKYFQNQKFENFFSFKSNLRTIWTKNFLVSILFFIGYFAMYFAGVAILIAIAQFLGFNANVMYYAGAIVLLFIIYVIMGGLYSSVNEAIRNK